jgi:inosine-uridine nucleoside N-ribohydrolase
MLSLLIDTDPGIDDALALLLAWGTPGVRVEAITTVAGNVPVATATRNVHRLVDLRRPDPTPLVAQGAERPLARTLVTATAYHGEDGLGDVRDWPAADVGSPGEEAVAVMLRAARRQTPPTLVALGPLTNLAVAIDADGVAMRRFTRVVAMGGAVDVPGNVTPTAEFNMHVDPDAAARVLDAGFSLDLVPLDATRQVVLTRADLVRALARRPGPLANRVAAFTDRAFGVDASRGTRGMVMHDPLAVAVAAEPGLVEWEPARLAIGADGETRRASGQPNCRIARGVDAPRVLARLLEALCPVS